MSFPSENVPAPPSPNCTLLFSSKIPLFQKSSTFFARRSIVSPLSKIYGLKPFSTSESAAKSPAGPAPIINGFKFESFIISLI